MSDLLDYASAVAVGGKVVQITGSIPEGAKAGGYAAWVHAVTGVPPVVKEIDGQAVILMNEEQIQVMQNWLDLQVGKAFQKPETRPAVKYDLGPVLQPWAVKRAVPVAMAVFLGGMITMWAINKAI